MKKLASLLAFGSIGLFSIGCDSGAVDDGPEPIPSEGTTVEGGSEIGGTTAFEDESSDVPPMTDELPPATPEPQFTPEPSFTPEPQTSEPATTEPETATEVGTTTAATAGTTPTMNANALQPPDSRTGPSTSGDCSPP